MGKEQGRGHEGLARVSDCSSSISTPDTSLASLCYMAHEYRRILRRTMPIVPATAEAIKEAARALARGDIVAFPTETVYGLGANALDGSAVAKIFAAKERPRFNPLIVHVPGLAEAETYAVVNAAARKLAEAFWPGPLSLVLEKRAGSRIADLVTAGLDTIALRSPAHPVARALLAEAKLPIAAPSANRSGRVSPTAATHVAA